MTIHLPLWLCWLIGIPIGLFVLAFAVLGVLLLIAMIRDIP